MDEYISREDVLGNSNIITVQTKEYGSIEVIPVDTIANIELADVQLVKHGRWDFQGYQLFKCTNCKEIFTQNQLEAMQNHIDQEEFTFPNFCPNCGAYMRGNTNE